MRGDFIEKKTEEGEYEDPIDSDFQQVQEALEQELNKGMADVRIENGEIKVTLWNPLPLAEKRLGGRWQRRSSRAGNA